MSKNNIYKAAFHPNDLKTNTIAELIQSPHYVFSHLNISFLIEEMEKNPDIKVVGIVDSKNEIKGLMTRKKLFDILGKHYGKEIIIHKTIQDFMKKNDIFKPVEKPVIFSWDTPVQNIVNQLHIDRNNDIQYYIIADKHNNFMGICSNIDILLYYINQTNLRLQESNQTKDKLLSIIAHDLRNPFNGILFFLDIMEKEMGSVEPEKIKEYLQLLKKSSNNAYELLENLLDWAKIQTGSIQMNPMKINLHQIVQGNIGLFSPMIQKKNIKIILEIAPDFELFIDPNILNTVIRNILNNSVKFSYNNGQISVSASAHEKICQIKIKDSGMGIKKEALNKMFKINGKITKKGTDGEVGSGLGLILCKDFIEMGQGNFEIDSEGEGLGTTVILTVPKNT